MAKNKKIYPPLDNPRSRFRRTLLRVVVNALVFVGLGVLYYAVFSFFFDTPAEYRMKRQDDKLRHEYEALAGRLEEVESVLDNVSARDRNVFNMLFESEPIDPEISAGSGLAAMDMLMSMTNNELYDKYSLRLAEAERNTIRMEELYDELYRTMSSLGAEIDNIPAIQPIINNGLTLLTASFGMRIHPFYKGLTQHNGVDFTVPEGTRVFATADGRVKETIKRSSSSGLTVVIDHGNGYETHYNHLSSVNVNRGQRVRRGDIIALTGNTGLSLVPHLHYEVHSEGQPVDPVHYFFMELSPAEYRRMIRIAQSGMQSFD